MLQPIKLQRVKVTGYRCLQDVELEPRGLNVLIGANGAGKSTVLDLFVVLAEAMRGRLARAISTRGGINRILTLEHAASLAVRVESSPVGWPGSSESEPLDYTLEVTPSGVGYSITKEELHQDRGHTSGKPFLFLTRKPGNLKYYDPKASSFVDPEWPMLTEEAALGQVPRTYPEPEALRSLMAHSLHAAPIVLDERSPLRLPQTLQPPEGAPNPSGSDLVSVLYEMRTSDEDLWEQLNDVLGAGFPRYRKLEFPLVAGGELLVQASDHVQIFVATHSAALVRWMKPADVVVVERDEEGCRLTRGDSMKLDEWLEDHTLDQIWQMGLMGGKPGAASSLRRATRSGLSAST